MFDLLIILIWIAGGLVVLGVLGIAAMGAWWVRQARDIEAEFNRKRKGW